MTASPFHTYVKTREFAAWMRGEGRLLGAFAAANIKVFPYQIAAAMFALRSPYKKGVILADEGSLGKTYEALLVASQLWLEGKTRQLLILPGNLVEQWTEKMERDFTLPFVVWKDGEMPSESEESLIITTYDHAVRHAEQIASHPWDMVIFDEADVLSSHGTKMATTLKAAIGKVFKVLLTPTPMKKDIMDIYGLLHFIDETVLPNEKEFYKRYFRKPENYPELAVWMSRYAFRTLKSQVTEYVNFTARVPFTPHIELTPIERELYALVEKFIALPNKRSYRMEPWELSLILFHSLSSSPQAFCKTIKNGIDRAEDAELALLTEIQKCAESIHLTAKMQALYEVLKKSNLPKAIVFTDNLTTLEVLKNFLLFNDFKVITTEQPDYAKAFRVAKTAILIATDTAAKGLDFEFCPMVVNYDLLWNAIEMEQRIARCHRQGQHEDVLVVNLLYRENMADVRILELINKRVLQFDGIFGMSDPLVGNFDTSLAEILPQLREKEEIAQAFADNLQTHKPENKKRVAYAEEMLFTTFTKEIADKVTLTPDYIEEKIEELNARMWEILRDYFARRDDYEIDEAARTLTLKSAEQPLLFYYHTGSRNKPYFGLKQYGIGREFRPAGGRITPTSPLMRGILNEVECADAGTLTVHGAVEPCEVGFYQVEIAANRKEIANFGILCGISETGKVLSESDCRAILEKPVAEWQEEGRQSAYWLKHGGDEPHKVDAVVPIEELKKRWRNEGAHAEEIERIKLWAARRRSAMEHELDDLRLDIKNARQQLAAQTSDRLRELEIGKQLKGLETELRKKEEGAFLEQLRIDVAAEEALAALENEKMEMTIKRHFIIQVRNGEIGRNEPECGTGGTGEASVAVSAVFQRRENRLEKIRGIGR